MSKFRKFHSKSGAYPEGWFGSRTGVKELDDHIKKYMPLAESKGYGYIYVLDYVDNKYKPLVEIRFFEKNGKSAENLFKTGFTTRRDSSKRPKEQQGTMMREEECRMRFFAPAVRKDGTPFTDKDIHRLLDADGYVKSDFGNESNQELYVIPNHRLEVIIEKYAEIIGIPVHFTHSGISLWPHQKEAVEKIVMYYMSDPSDPCFFLCVKCRGGKTIIALTAAVELGARRILIVSFKPVNEDSWIQDAKRITGLEDAIFIAARKGKNGSVDVQFQKADGSKIIICYVSWQDLHNGEKKKHSWLKDVDWDVVLWDEYHWGSYKGNPRALFFDDEFVQFKAKRHIFITGTGMKHVPHFLPEQVFSWTYLDERKAIETWDASKQGRCPYKTPKMNVLCVNVPEIAETLALSGENSDFSLNEFFAVKKGDNGTVEFVRRNAVVRWLDSISGCNGDAKDVYDALSGIHKYPWADPKLRKILQHTLFVLPSVDACKVLEDLMKEHPFFKNYKIINCSGSNGGSGREALNYVRREIGDPMKSQTITLTCRKLLDSVTVNCWSAVCFLCDFESLEMYIQAMFRCASEWLTGNGMVLKPDCYVLDFSPFRAVKMRSEWIDSQCSTGASSAERKLVVEDFSKFAPFISLANGTMRTIDADEFLKEESKVLSSLTRRHYFGSPYFVTTDIVELKKIAKNPEMMNILANVPDETTPCDNVYHLNAVETSLKKIKNRATKIEYGKGTKGVFEEIRRKATYIIRCIPLAQAIIDERVSDFIGLLNAKRSDLIELAFQMPVKDLKKIAESNLFVNNKIRCGMEYFNRVNDEACAA